jgi:capsular polysaccharide biosynthesis protein
LVADIRIDWRALRRVIAAGAIAAVVAGGVAFLVSQALPKGYDAEARVLVGSLTATSTDELDAYHRLSLTYAELANSSLLLKRVIDRLGLPDDPAGLASRVDARATSQGIVVIAATAASPDEAVQIANSIAAEVLILATPSGRVASLAEVIQPATPPDHPSSPNVLINTLVAGSLGLALGLAAGFALARRQSSTTSVAEMPSLAWPGGR